MANMRSQLVKLKIFKNSTFPHVPARMSQRGSRCPHSNHRQKGTTQIKSMDTDSAKLKDFKNSFTFLKFCLHGPLRMAAKCSYLSTVQEQNKTIPTPFAWIPKKPQNFPPIQTNNSISTDSPPCFHNFPPALAKPQTLITCRYQHFCRKLSTTSTTSCPQNRCLRRT